MSILNLGGVCIFVVYVHVYQEFLPPPSSYYHTESRCSLIASFVQGYSEAETAFVLKWSKYMYVLMRYEYALPR